jgi:hypothetical protein
MEKPEDLKKDSDAEMTVALFQAARSEDFDLVKKLISDGADPLATQPSGVPNLLLILYYRLINRNNDNVFATLNVLQIILYILNLPEYQELSEKSEAIYHNTLLRMARDLPYYFEIVSPMLQFMFKFKAINNLIFEETTKQSNILPQVIKMNPTALFIFYLMRDGKLFDKNAKIPHQMLEIGFSMQESQDCVTPLTTLLLIESHYETTETEMQNLKKVVHKFMENGVNIESSVLSVQSVFEEPIPDLDTMKTLLMVPDVLYLSFWQSERKLLAVFLPYWWAPPLALLSFNIYSACEFLVCSFFDELSEYGGVPHGTTMFAGLCEMMEEVRRNIRVDTDFKDYSAQLSRYYCTYKNLVGKNEMNYILPPPFIFKKKRRDT